MNWEHKEDDEIKRSTIESSIQKSIYKIHLQIKPCYLISFTCDFLKFVASDERLVDICRFKISPDVGRDPSKYWFGSPVGKNIIATIVIYLEQIPVVNGNNEYYKTIDRIIKALVDRYEGVSDRIALKYEDAFDEVKNRDKVFFNEHADKYVVPRFNYKINNFIYVAGGNADLKKELSNEKLEKHFTGPNWAFYKGYEYKYEPTEQSISQPQFQHQQQEKQPSQQNSLKDGLKSALELLKTKLSELKGMFGGSKQKIVQKVQ